MSARGLMREANGTLLQGKRLDGGETVKISPFVGLLMIGRRRSAAIKTRVEVTK